MFFVGCASPGPHVPGGALFSSVHGPNGVGTGKGNASKTGKACGSNILGLVAMGDNSIEAAKKDGNIKAVSFVDYDFFSVLGFYAKVCTIVKGS